MGDATRRVGSRVLRLSAVLGLATALTLSVPATAPAWANVSDGFGLGIGTGLGVHSSSSPDHAGDAGLIGDVNVRARFLWILGVDLRIGLQDEDAVRADDGPQFGARYRTTALVYVVPTSVVSVYVGGGIGALSASELFSTGAEGSSYHGGLGVEWYASDRVALDLSFMMVVPGWRSVERDVERRVGLEVMRFQADPSGGAPAVPDELPVGDYVSLRNFELVARAMITF